MKSVLNALIMGYGKSGKAAERYLDSIGYNVYIYDDKLDLSHVTNVYNKSIFYDIIVPSPAFRPDNEIIRRHTAQGSNIITEPELCLADTNLTIVGVTGTNGKTTVTEMISHILSCCGVLNKKVGNIGLPICDVYEYAIKNDSTLVFELSSFQLLSANFIPIDVGVILNVEPDHLDWHIDMDEYVSSKQKIVEFVKKRDGRLILNYDNILCLETSQKMDNKKIYYFSTKTIVDNGIFVRDNRVYFSENGKESFVCDITDINYNEGYNLENSFAAICACTLLGIEANKAAFALKTYKKPKYRNDYVATIKGIKIFNDSKGTNIASTLAALKQSSEKTVLIAGGYDKNLDYTQLFEGIDDNVFCVLLFGQNKYKIARYAKHCGYYNYFLFDDLKSCVKFAIEMPEKYERLVFSPTTSSFDMFTSYVERGAYFDEIIASLSQEYQI